jgi:hypothetical protein
MHEIGLNGPPLAGRDVESPTCRSAQAFLRCALESIGFAHRTDADASKRKSLAANGRSHQKVSGAPMLRHIHLSRLHRAVWLMKKIIGFSPPAALRKESLLNHQRATSVPEASAENAVAAYH